MHAATINTNNFVMLSMKLEERSTGFGKAYKSDCARYEESCIKVTTLLLTGPADLMTERNLGVLEFKLGDVLLETAGAGHSLSI